MNIKNTNLTINVSQMEQSISFYQSLGFILKQRWDNHYAQLTAPGIEIGLHPLNKADKPKTNVGQTGSGNLSLGFTTEDFENTKSELKHLGIDVVERIEEGGAFLHFNDPDGTSLYFIRPNL